MLLHFTLPMGISATVDSAVLEDVVTSVCNEDSIIMGSISTKTTSGLVLGTILTMELEVIIRE